MKTKADIYARFPKLLENVYCGWWLADDSGWNDVIYKVLTAIAAEPCNDGTHGGPASIAQVKEKFGGIRMYIENATGTQEQCIRELETICWFTCEDCGTTRDVETSGSWLKTLCTTCRNS